MPYKNYKSYETHPIEKKKSVKASRQRFGDYRIFVGAFPTGELAEQIQKLREEIDPITAKITAPHVTLAGTYWRNGKPTRAGAQGLIDKLEELKGRIKPFNLQLGGIQTFGERVIYLGAETSQPMLSVRGSLINAIGEDKHRRFKAHLTLAMHLEQPAFDETLAKLRESEWENGRFSIPITELHLMQRGENDAAWRKIYTIPLK